MSTGGPRMDSVCRRSSYVVKTVDGGDPSMAEQGEVFESQMHTGGDQMRYDVDVVEGKVGIGEREGGNESHWPYRKEWIHTFAVIR